MEIRNLISITDFSVEEIDKMIGVAGDIMTNPDKYIDICKGKKLATLFFEPSTRTRLSFEAAMLELGGSVLGFSEASSSSAAKGESVSDTIRTVGCYADIIAMRHPKEGAPVVAARRTTVPIINDSSLLLFPKSSNKHLIINSNLSLNNSPFPLVFMCNSNDFIK